MRLEFPILFPPWLLKVGRVVLSANDDVDRLAGCDEVGEFEREWRVAALVVAGVDAVDPHGGGIVHCTEVQHQPAAAGEIGCGYLQAIPDGAVEARIAQAAGLCFGSKWDLDGTVPDYFGRMTQLGAAVESEVPRAVKGLPLGAAKLWPRVVGDTVQGFGIRENIHGDRMPRCTAGSR